MGVSVKGFDQKTLTFTTTSALKPGDFVEFSSNYTVIPCKSGNTPIGICTGKRGIFVTVLIKGYARIKYTTPLPRGLIKIKASTTPDIAVNSTTDGLPIIVTFDDPKEKTVEAILA